MRRTLVFVLLLSVMAIPTFLSAAKKPTPVDIKNFNKVFIGWVDVNPDDYHKLGYGSKEEWSGVINGANVNFQKNLASSSAFSGKTVTSAKDRTDTNTAGNDLYVKFTDAQFDHKYRLHIAVHFIDLKSNSEIGSVPLETYGAHLCSLSGCLDKELAEVNKKIQELAGTGK
jgi:hypothetical protein